MRQAVGSLSGRLPPTAYRQLPTGYCLLKIKLHADLEQSRYQDRCRLPPRRTVSEVLADDGVRVQHVVEIEVEVRARRSHSEYFCHAQVELVQSLDIELARFDDLERLERDERAWTSNARNDPVVRVGLNEGPRQILE